MYSYLHDFVWSCSFSNMNILTVILALPWIFCTQHYFNNTLPIDLIFNQNTYFFNILLTFFYPHFHKESVSMTFPIKIGRHFNVCLTYTGTSYIAILISLCLLNKTRQNLPWCTFLHKICMFEVNYKASNTVMQLCVVQAVSLVTEKSKS
jgi:hypothetical protein